MQAFTNNRENPKASSGSNLDQMFVFQYQFQESEDYSIYFYIESFHSERMIKHHMLFQTTVGWQDVVQNMDYQIYEGDWIFVYCFADLAQEQIIGYYYSQTLSQILVFFTVPGVLKINSKMKGITGGITNIYIQNQSPLFLQGFPGIITPIIITNNENVFVNLKEFLHNCELLTWCNPWEFELVPFDTQISNEILYSNQIGKKGRYLLSGWIKQDVLLQNQQQEQLLLRMSANEQYLDDSQIGDKTLYIKYYQNNIDKQQNGFTVSTYSYIFPFKPSQYATDASDIISAFDKSYKDTLTQWHFFQFEIGSQTNNGQPIYRVFYGATGEYKDYTWSKPIHHFTVPYFHFNIGGDDYFPNKFSGYLSSWNFMQICDEGFTSFLPLCDSSCETCNGIQPTDCLSCNENQRVYTPQHTCKCKYGLIENPDRKICIEPNEYDEVLSMREIEISCDKEGFYQCDKDATLCNYGYFLYNNQCIKCPHFDSYNKDVIVACPDCYLFPQLFNQSLSCTFQFISPDPLSVYSQDTTFLEIYTIYQTNELTYELLLMEGLKANGQCDYGYRQIDTYECKPCSHGCKQCESDQICRGCFTGYYLREEQNCVKCESCSPCQFKLGREICLKAWYCFSGYWQEDTKKCVDCGQYCDQCEEDQCRFCIDISKYYITLDNVNCAKCTIDHCKYCFQFIYLNDGSIITTLDIRTAISSLNPTDMRTGCALCEKTYFFSFITLKCEKQPLNFQDCDFGIIDEQETAVCIQSDTRQDSVQKTICQDQYCAYCINDYSTQIDSLCTLCREGYYSEMLTGLCKPCPINCEVCFQQNYQQQNYWKSSIRAFYNIFINSHNDHPFEIFALSSQLEIACIRCSQNYMLYSNNCYPDCGSDCLNCRIFLNQSIRKVVTSCDQCIPAPENSKRSLSPVPPGSFKCLDCPDYCIACLPRTSDQITTINPSFNQYSPYNKYSHACYSHFQDTEIGTFSNIPIQSTPNICLHSTTCEKELVFTYFVFCQKSHFTSTKLKYTSFQDIQRFGDLQKIEKKELFDYMNNVNINKATYQLELIYYSGDPECRIYLATEITNNLHDNVFSLKYISLNFLGTYSFRVPFNFQETLTIRNYERVSFQNISIQTATHQQTDSFESTRALIMIQNDYFPVSIIFDYSSFSQGGDQNFVNFSFTSNRPQYLTINHMDLKNLLIMNSSVFDFQPTSEEKFSTQSINDFTINNSTFSNTSLFYYAAKKHSLNYVLTFQNIQITNTKFLSSYFINSTFLMGYDVGVIELKNVILKNVNFSNNSAFINFLCIQKLSLENFTLINLTFFDSSSFLISNTITIHLFHILNCVINSGYFITNQGIYSQSEKVQLNSKSMSFSSISFRDIIYSNFTSFIYIVDNQQAGITLNCSDLTLNNNTYVNSILGASSFNFVSYKSTLIFIQCSYCTFTNLTILRGVGLAEISILNSQQLTIKNLFIQLNSIYYRRMLQTSVDCMKQFGFLDLYFVVYIGQYHELTIENSIIQDSIIIDHPFIQIIGVGQTDKFQFDIITIQNSIFSNNILLITEGNRFSSIFSIQTEQPTTITITKTKFINNHLNQYYQDTELHSPTTMLIQAQSGNITLSSSIFEQNVVTNSSDAILYIKAQSLSILNCNFNNSNLLNAAVMERNILLSKDLTVLDETISNYFLILSNGGNGYLFINELSILDTNIVNSIATNGGGFYISTLAKGKILISNSNFQNTSTVLSGYQLQSGGLFYIDATHGKLDIKIESCSVTYSFSRTLGGAIYVEPSRIENSISFNNLTMQSVFSLQHSILSFSPSKFISIGSNVEISNSYFSSNEQEFEAYIAKISDLSQQNIYPFQRQNPSIYVQFSIFKMSNCKFENVHLANLLEINEGININLISVFVFNSNIFQSPYIRLSLRQGLTGKIQMTKVTFQNLLSFHYNDSLQCKQTYSKDLIILCPLDTENINSSPVLQYSKPNLIFQQFCNLDQLYTASRYNFSLIELINFEKNHQIYIQDLTMTNINCNFCYYGILSIQGFNLQSQQFRFNNIQLLNNICGQLGCFSILKSITDDYLTQIISTEGENSNHISVSEIKEDQFQAVLSNSRFINNTANYGAACFFGVIDLLVTNSYFANNEASIKGGAIYYISNQSQILFLNSQITENKAPIAGGIYLSSNQLQRTKELNLYFDDNKAFQYADQLKEAPRKLELLLTKGSRQKNCNLRNDSITVIDQVIIDPYRLFKSEIQTEILFLPIGISIAEYKYFDSISNSYVPFNITFRIIASNIFDEQLTNLENSQCKLFATMEDKLNSTTTTQIDISNTNSNHFLSKTSVYFDSDSGDYNLDDLIIYFNPQTEERYYLQLAFSCDSIQIPYYAQSSDVFPTSIIRNYLLLLNMRTFQCQLGEYLNSTSGGCVLCDTSQNQYSVTINSSSCSFKDEIKMKNIEPAMIELRETYWRAFYFSQKIELCYHLLSNCQGGWLSGNPSCALGHIGALCEQCDLYNLKGDGSFSQNQYYQCSSCNEMEGNILNIIFVIVWTFLSVLITVTSTIKMIQDFIFQLKLKPFGQCAIVKSASTSVLLKVFTNYFQIISSISSFQLDIPIGVTLAVRGVGNPIESMAFSLDCYLISLDTVSIIYLRIIWGFLTAGIYIMLFFLLHLLMFFITKAKLNITFITTTLIYIYIYLSPNLVSELSFLISYRNISDEQWISANVAYLYNTEQHKKWLISFVGPLFFVVSILLPFFFWYIVYHHRTQLNTTRIRKVWGYLYNEYKVTTYYWETVKILQKELIILVVIYYEDYVPIKACLIFFILHLYSKLTSQYKPYLTSDLNIIDNLSTSICKISIILAQSIYLAQSLGIQEIIWPFYAVLACINFLFIVQLLSKLLLAYFEKLYEQLDKLKSIISYSFPSIVKKNKFCSKLLQNTTEKKYLIRKRFQSIRRYLIDQARQIILLKEQNNMALTSQEQEYKPFRKAGIINIATLQTNKFTNLVEKQKYEL